MKIIEFKNKKYLLVGDLTDAAIATKHQYENGLESYAHLFSSGNIQRYGEIIGNVKDIKIIGEDNETEPDLATALHVGLFGFTDK